MSHVSDKLRQKIVEQARNRCGYCLGEQRYVLRRLKLTTYVQQPKAEQTTKKIFGLPARYAMLTKARKLTALILSPNGKFRSLTRAGKVGKDILGWSTASRLSARQQSGAPLLLLCK